MSYAIIRNSNYKKGNLAGLYKHNERKNTNYSNKNIDKSRFKYNYSLKRCNTTYLNAFKNLQTQYNLKGRIISTTNILCEYVITSDKDFFEKIGEQETIRYFKTAYKFVANYQNLGEEFILSAKIHNDEATPHMHIVFVPVIHKQDKESGQIINKIACSEYWKGRDSYRRLQDNFYKYMTRAGFELERGLTGNIHLETDKLKKVTNYEVQKYQMQSLSLEQDKEITDTEELKEEHKRVIRKFNTLAKQYTRIKNLTDNTNQRCEDMEIEYRNIKLENSKLKKEINVLKNYIDKTLEWASIVLNWPVERVTNLINEFIEKSNMQKLKEKNKKSNILEIKRKNKIRGCK